MPSDKTATNTKFGYLGCFMIVMLLFAGVYNVYQRVDSWGLIPHHADSEISIHADWLVGEIKTCASNPVTKTYLGVELGYAVLAMNCDDGPSHRLNITFWGRTVQPEYSAVYWNCTRKETAEFVCTEINGIAK